MNIDQVQAAAETQKCYLSNPSGIKISVASSMTDLRVPPVLNLFLNAIDQGKLRARTFRTGSFGFYDLEPIAVVEMPDNFALLYKNVIPESTTDLIPSLITGIPGKTGAFCSMGENRVPGVPHISELPLFCLQTRTALRNCGWIDPEDIGQYLGRGRGYTGLAKALRMNPAEIVESWVAPQLKDRAGLGFSNIDHWKLSCSLETGGTLICNAVDLDPGSPASRLLLEGDPHSVLEGMLISAFAIGASDCILWVEEGALAGKLKTALDQMRGYSLLGANILDSGFCAEIRVEEVPASAGSGHCTELMRCLEEGWRLPKILPAWPVVDEIRRPVVTAAPEMMSRLSAVLCDGNAEGTESKIVTLAGSVNHRYTVEVSPSTSIRTIIDLIGGGIHSGKSLKAVQIDSPSGPFITPDALNNPIGCNEDKESTFFSGSGTIEVLDSDCCILEKMKEIMAGLQARSCGKCVLCREGCLQILTVLEDISENKSQPQDLDFLAALCREMRTGCLCAFGRAVPDPVLTSLARFRADYEKRMGDEDP